MRGGLEQLKHPGGGQAVTHAEREVDNRRPVGAIGAEPEEAPVSCPRPQMPLVIAEQVVNVLVWQSIEFGVA